VLMFTPTYHARPTPLVGSRAVAHSKPRHQAKSMLAASQPHYPGRPTSRWRRDKQVPVWGSKFRAYVLRIRRRALRREDRPPGTVSRRKSMG
jgi:hypothetical protein